MSSLEIFAVLISVIAVALTVKRHILCWLFNFVGAIIYGYLFYLYQLYAETLLQGFFMLMAIYGFITWQKQNKEQPSFTVQQIAIRSAILQIIATLILGLIFGLSLQHFTQADLPLLDAQLVAFSLLGTFWATRKYVATWVLWIVLDVIYVGMFIYKELFLTAALYAGFVGLACWGLVQWQRTRQCSQNKMTSSLS